MTEKYRLYKGVTEMDRRWGKNAPFSRWRGGCPGGHSGINRLAQRFRHDPAFRKAVENGYYRYSNGMLAPGFNNGDVATVVGTTMPKGVIPVETVPSVRVSVGKRASLHPHYRRTPDSGYRRKIDRIAPKGYPKGNRGRLREQRNQSRIFLNPGTPTSGFTIAAVAHLSEELLQLICNRDFGQTLKITMEFLHVSVAELAIESHIDDRKIVRLRNNETKSVCREDVLALVIGLHLPPPVGIVFFQNAHIYVGDLLYEDVIYRMILGLMSQSSVDEVNVELRKAGLGAIPRNASGNEFGAYLE